MDCTQTTETQVAKVELVVTQEDERALIRRVDMQYVCSLDKIERRLYNLVCYR